MSYSESVGMFELSRINPKAHVIDKIAKDVIEAARLGAELFDGHAVRLPPSPDVWTKEVWSALIDHYFDEGIEPGQKFAVYLLDPDIVKSRLAEGSSDAD